MHGTRDEGRQMVKGFLSRKFASHTLERKEDTQLSFIATPIGDYAITLSDTYNFSIPYNATFVYRVKIDDNIFHSYSYNRKKSSASYYAHLKKGDFVKIDHFIVVGGERYCLCNRIRKLRKITEDLSITDASVKNHLDDYCKTYAVSFTETHFATSVNNLCGNIILVNWRNSIFATQVLKNLETE